MSYLFTNNLLKNNPHRKVLPRAKIFNPLTGWLKWRTLMMEWKKFQPADFTDHVNCARLISAGLSTQLLSRWIKHPQALTDIGHRRPKFPTLSRSADDFNKHVVFGGMGREPKKTPPSVPSYVGHCFAATRSTLSKDMDKVFNMIYTFIIAQPWL